MDKVVSADGGSIGDDDRLDKAVSEVTSYERERTKRVVYAVMYGAGREKLSEVLHIKQSEAHDIISSFMSKDYVAFNLYAMHTFYSFMFCTEII